MKIKEASGVLKWWMETSGFWGLTTPWAIYLRPDRYNDPEAIAHEEWHGEQIEELGVLKFYLKYLWYSLRYGYWANPFEVEARLKAKQVTAI